MIGMQALEVWTILLTCSRAGEALMLPELPEHALRQVYRQDHSR